MSHALPWDPAAEGHALVDMRPQDALWQPWLAGGLDIMPAAADGLEDLGQARPGTAGALPADYGRHLRQEVDAGVAAREHRFAIRNNITALEEGRALPLVTGQQPGFAGGPLYTLLKITSVVALARMLREQGRPAVPVFWLGDDDDDLREALAARAWWPGRDGLLAPATGAASDSGRQAVIGTLGGRRLESPWIRALRQDGVPVDQVWEEALDSLLATDPDLSRWTVQTLWRLFGKDGLVIVRGHDPRLHASAAEFYRLVIPRLETLRARAREGRDLAVKRFGCAPLAENSLLRPLYGMRGEHRIPVPDADLMAEASAADTSRLRCGVMLRALLQDWLLGPAAVVVGPGELGYLTQLLPLYRELGLPRSPLLPRLFGWVIPRDLPMAGLMDAAGAGPLDATQATDLATAAAETSRAVLEHILTQMGLPEERAASLAAGRSRRWAKGVGSMLRDESRRLAVERRAAYPPWIFPEGLRQERKLAWAPLAAVWGEPFLQALLEAARRHWQDGRRGAWREYLVRVPEHLLTGSKGSP
ncbi:hypothetical protein CSA17_00380 [bacterium DOLJORAL78_65_58]|nr:MAG: hypothetical protein CSB20_01515 [bacterium DOLZORAL124_64_63]PIE76792.1 MAG: hypothetical protein CSA17_00380 [bacterium DOLJORAL78_65_58]